MLDRHGSSYYPSFTELIHDTMKHISWPIDSPGQGIVRAYYVRAAGVSR